MKLLNCHIENFGKLSNFDYDFNYGLNVIKEENGFGKTTFADFIKAMFYGLETKRNTKNLTDRKKYEPWQGGAFGGNITFETNNKKYKIERFFAKKEADDIFKLYDLATNLESAEFSQNIGEELFKINKEAFERCIFISGQNTETSMNDSINAKLGNILENENDVNTSDNAVKILDDAIKVYKKTGGRGEISEKLTEKTKLEKKLEQSKIDEKNLEERKNKNEAIKQKITNMQKDEEIYKKLLTEKIEQEAKKIKIEQYKRLVDGAEKCKVNIEQFKIKIENDTELKEKQQISQNKLDNIKQNICLIDEKIKKQKKISVIIIAIALVCTLTLGIMLLQQLKIIEILFSIITLIALIAFVMSTIDLNKKKNIFLERTKEKANIEEIMETLNSLYKKQTEEKSIELKRLEKEYEEKIQEITNYEVKNNIRELLNTQNYLSIDCNESKEEITEKINIIRNEINKLNDEKNYNKNQIEIIESNLETVFDIENELEDMNEQISEMTEKLKILEQTKKYLTQAKEQFSSHYLGGMKESFLRNLELINGEELTAELDVNLDIKINEMGSDKDIRYFSTGYKDLIYICMRLSLIQALFEDEKPFIILDDPFVNLDDVKIQNAMALLKNISDKYQLIYFVCHDSRK